MKEAHVSPCKNGDRWLETEDLVIFQTSQLQKCKSDIGEDARVLQNQQDLPSVLLSLLDIRAVAFPTEMEKFIPVNMSVQLAWSRSNGARSLFPVSFKITYIPLLMKEGI